MATETWLLNDVVHPSVAFVSNVLFISNSNNYSKFSVVDAGIMYQLVYGDTVVFSDDTSTWTSQAYRTITFAEPVTDSTLLTWLQANGIKQGGATMINIDLTTLSGYESLAAGTYQLGVKAKAQGYQDSDLSQTVSFTKLAAPVVTASDTTVTWDAVTNAESYDVYVDGELYENTTGG